jgi:hypothetical protein
MNVLRNQQGITTTTIIGFVVILGIVGFTGWRVMEANRAIDENTIVSNQPVKGSGAEKSESKNTTIPEGYIKYESGAISFNYPEAWGEATQQSFTKVNAENRSVGSRDPIVLLGFSQLAKEVSLFVWDVDEVAVSLAFNAPVYCTVKSGEWIKAPGSLGENVSCPSDTRESNGKKIARFNRGALGAYAAKEAYIYDKVVLELSVSSTVKDIVPNSDGSGSVGEAAKKRIKGQASEYMDQLTIAN